MSERTANTNPNSDEKIWDMVYNTLVYEKKEEFGHTPTKEELDPELSQLEALFERKSEDA